MKVLHVYKGYGGHYFLVPAQYRDRQRRAEAQAALTRIESIVPSWLHAHLDVLSAAAYKHGRHIQLEAV